MQARSMADYRSCESDDQAGTRPTEVECRPRRSSAPLSPASGWCPHLIATLCIVVAQVISATLPRKRVVPPPHRYALHRRRAGHQRHSQRNWPVPVGWSDVFYPVTLVPRAALPTKLAGAGGVVGRVLPGDPSSSSSPANETGRCRRLNAGAVVTGPRAPAQRNIQPKRINRLNAGAVVTGPRAPAQRNIQPKRINRLNAGAVVTGMWRPPYRSFLEPGDNQGHCAGASPACGGHRTDHFSSQGTTKVIVQGHHRHVEATVPGDLGGVLDGRVPGRRRNLARRRSTTVTLVGFWTDVCRAGAGTWPAGGRRR